MEHDDDGGPMFGSWLLVAAVLVLLVLVAPVVVVAVIKMGPGSSDSGGLLFPS